MQNNSINITKKSNISKVKKLTLSGVLIGIYVSVMLMTQSFAFGQYQVRIATSIYSLSAIHPFLIIPMGIANLLSNTVMGGLGPLDMIGGFIVGVITSYGCFQIRRISVYLITIPIILVPALVVPIWLSYLINVPYGILALSIGLGQVIPGFLGVLLVKSLEKHFYKLEVK